MRIGGGEVPSPGGGVEPLSPEVLATVGSVSPLLVLSGSYSLAVTEAEAVILLEVGSVTVMLRVFSSAG